MISRSWRPAVALVAAFFVGCSGEDGTGPGSGDDTANADPSAPGWAVLESLYRGAIESTSQGIAYSAELSMLFTQFHADIFGSFDISGILTGDTFVFGVEGTGSFTSTLEAREDPSVDITFVNQCPGYSARFTGALDSTTDLLTISGPAHILWNCEIVLTFESTILMSRVLLLEDGTEPSPTGGE